MAAPRTAFRFTNSRLSFALAGTLGDRGTARPLERLSTPDSLADWFLQAGVSTQPIDVSPDQLADAVALREAIYGIGKAIAENQPVPRLEIDLVNRAAAHIPSRPVMSLPPSKSTWTTQTVEQGLSVVAADAIQTYTDSSLGQRIRLCENPKCCGLYVDESHPGNRRWCSMQTCGAAAKKRAQRAKAHQAVLASRAAQRPGSPVE